MLSDYEGALGSENPYILECKNNLAVVYSLQGWYGKSVKLHYEILNIREQVLGLAHPNTLQTMSSLSFVYLNQGLMEKAIDTGLHALKMKKAVLGLEHPDILINIQNLAVAHDFLGERHAALEYGEILVDLSSKINGDHHPDTLRSLSVLAIIYVGMGKWDKSENLLHEAREGLEKSAGKDHPDTMGATFGLVAQYLMQNRLDEAEKLAVPLLEQRQRVVGPEHPGTLVVMNQLANIWKRQGHGKKALELKEACLRSEEKMLGSKHHLTIGCYNDLTEWRKESTEDHRSDTNKMPCNHYIDEHPRLDNKMKVDQVAIQHLGVGHGLVAHTCEDYEGSSEDEEPIVQYEPKSYDFKPEKAMRKVSSLREEKLHKERNYHEKLERMMHRRSATSPVYLPRTQPIPEHSALQQGVTRVQEKPKLLIRSSSNLKCSTNLGLRSNADYWKPPSESLLPEHLDKKLKVHYQSDASPRAGKPYMQESPALFRRRLSYHYNVDNPRPRQYSLKPSDRSLKQNLAPPQHSPSQLPFSQPKPRPQAQGSTLVTRASCPHPAPYKSALAYCSFSGSTKVMLILGSSKG